MSDSDSFIEEVTEEVRRDRLFRLMSRYGWIAIVAVVILVGGAAWNEWSKARARSAAEASGDAVLAALQIEDATERLAAFRKIELVGPSRAVIGFMIADTAMQAKEHVAAEAVLNVLINDKELPPRYHDLAVLKRSMLLARKGNPEERIADLVTIASPGAPYRLLAEEQIALAELAAGDKDAALNRLRRLAEETEAGAGQRRRVQELIEVLGGAPVQG